MAIEDQAEKLTRVKRSHGHVVEQPLRLPRGTTLREARAYTRKHNITGILIEEGRGSGVLAGLLSNRDMPWAGGGEDRPVEEFMTPASKLVTGAPDIGVGAAERLMFDRRIEKLPLVDAQGRIRGLITKKDIILSAGAPLGEGPKGRLLVGAAIGAAATSSSARPSWSGSGPTCWSSSSPTGTRR
jgi:IMP dehydrogenase